MAACNPGTYLLLGPGYFSAANQWLEMLSANGVTVRGSGPQSTTLTITGTGAILWGESWGAGSATWSAGYSSGTNSITLAGATGPGLSVGALLNLVQCDSGFSGSGCNTGTSADNGGLYICAAQASTNPCAKSNRANGNSTQTQTVYVTSVSGTCSSSCTVTFSPALYLSNWSSGRSPFATWQAYTSGNVVAPHGIGLEALTVYENSPTSNPAIQLNTYASWIKGVRIIGNNGGSIGIQISGKSNLLSNNYSYTLIPSSFTGADGINFYYTGSDNLMLNNICGVGDCMEGTGVSSDVVMAYNYSRDGNTAYYASYSLQHDPVNMLSLFEGNQLSNIEDDDTWGSHVLNTFFRNNVSCGDPPYVIPGGGVARGIVIDSFSRVENLIGNVGNSSGQCTSVSGTSASGPVFQYDTAGTDSAVITSLLRWGNVTNITSGTDTPANSGIRFASSEVPTPSSITTCATSAQCNNLSSFGQAAPSDTLLPCSFFGLTGTATSCTPFSGGTGINWWKVCISWSSFPASCSATQTQPFPSVGPDVSSGAYVNGHAYDIPAALAWYHLPIDTTWQNSYTITGSNWSGGVETLTVSSLPSAQHVMGPFSFSGVNSACVPTTTPFLSTNPNSEAFMTASTSTTVSYSLSDPGVACTGVMKFPNVRQFDESIYMADTSSNTGGSTHKGKGVFKGKVIIK